MVASFRTRFIMETLSSVYTLKEGNKIKIPYGPLDVYLGTNIHQLWNPDADED